MLVVCQVLPVGMSTFLQPEASQQLLNPVILLAATDTPPAQLEPDVACTALVSPEMLLEMVHQPWRRRGAGRNSLIAATAASDTALIGVAWPNSLIQQQQQQQEQGHAAPGHLAGWQQLTGNTAARLLSPRLTPTQAPKPDPRLGSWPLSFPSPSERANGDGRGSGAPHCTYCTDPCLKVCSKGPDSTRLLFGETPGGRAPGLLRGMGTGGKKPKEDSNGETSAAARSCDLGHP